MNSLAVTPLSLALLLGLAVCFSGCSSGEPSKPGPTPSHAPELPATQTPAPAATDASEQTQTPEPADPPAPTLMPTKMPTPAEVNDDPEDNQTGLGSLPDDPTGLMLATFDQPFIQVARKMAGSGNQVYIPVLVEFLRFQTDDEAINTVVSFMSRLKDNVPLDEVMVFPREQRRWGWWIEWLGQHPEVQAPDGYAGWKGELFSILGPGMGAFLYDGVKAEIRIEEIVWGGVAKDGIPDLRNPPTVPAEAANYLNPDDRVFGLSINGEHRAYPLRILNPHEMANDALGGVDFALAY